MVHPVLPTKNLIVCILCTLLGGAGALPTRASLTAAGSDLTVTATVSAVSQYSYRGVRRGGPSLQPYLEATVGGFSFGLWANTPLQDRVPGQSTPEIDPYGSYTFDLAKDLSLQPGFILYTYPAAQPKDGFYRLTFEPNLALNYTVEDIKLTLKFCYDTVLKQALAEFNVAYAIPLKNAGTEIDFLGTVGTFKATDAIQGTMPDVKNYGNYWQAGLSLPFQVTKEGKLTIGWAYVKGSDNFFKQGKLGKSANAAAVGRGVATLSYAIAF